MFYKVWFIITSIILGLLFGDIDIISELESDDYVQFLTEEMMEVDR